MKLVLIGKKRLMEQLIKMLHEDIAFLVVEKNKYWSIDGIINYCENFGISYSYNAKDIFKLKDIDYIISAQSSTILNKRLLSYPKYGCLNIHFGKLPEYRGFYPVYHQIINGEKYAFTTIHFMDESIDTGDIVIEGKIPIADKTAEKIFYELCDKSCLILGKIYKDMKLGYLTRKKQEGIAHYYDKNSVDFKERLEYFNRLYRALYFPRFQIPELNNKRSGLDEI